MRQLETFCATLALAALVDCSATKAEERVEYLKHVKPVLAERCYACHGGLAQESGLRLDTAKLAIQGGDSGPAVVPGSVSDSLLIQRVTATDDAERMPPEGPPLKPEQIAALKSWIEQKAEAPADEQPQKDPRDHWAFKPIVRPDVPSVTNSTWVRTPIDAFVAARHEQLGLTPQPEPSRDVLVRRLYLDLIGLPPTEDELVQANADNGDDWYERLVQRLLDDPRHGERWARHWMDIWRYSDWWGLGDQLRNSHAHIWHWRDWLVESLNANMSYDEMIRLMLAADELHPNDLDKLRATGYLARNWSLLFRNLWMEETVEHVSKGFLGLTMNCTKCHSHKYDPITQTDYYRMRAIFEPYQARLELLPGEADLARDAIPRVFDGPEIPTYRFERGQETQPDKSRVIAPGVPAFLEFEKLDVKPVSLPREVWQPERRPWVLETYLTAATNHGSAAEKALAPVREKLEAAQKKLREIVEKPPLDEPARKAAQTEVNEAQAEFHVVYLALDAARLELASVQRRADAMRAAWAKEADSTGNPALVEAEQSSTREALIAERKAAVAKYSHAAANAEYRLQRAPNEKKYGIGLELEAARESLAKAEQGVLAEIKSTDRYTILAGASWTATRFQSTVADDPHGEFPSQSTGRRTALAAWLTDRRNPLTARVAVNHLWNRHLGTPLVPVVFDFGVKGTPPTHPELLDWLASEFVESGWDMKHLHRLIVTSSVYRMSSSSAGAEANVAKDPENVHLWRRTHIRIESQVVRDSILSLAGTLDLKRGGPSVLPADQPASTRRSLYFFHSNNDRNVFLTSFDEASVNECYRRDQSIIPQQALALSNSGLVLDASQRIAKRLADPSSNSGRQLTDREFIDRAYYALLAIHPNDDEIATSAKALDEWRKLPDAPPAGSGDRAREYLVWALFNHNDFVTVR